MALVWARGKRICGPESGVERVARCRAVVSSSLHGLITAHAYGIPAVPVSFGDRLYGDNVKFLDYALSVGVEKPIVKPVALRRQDPASGSGW